MDSEFYKKLFKWNVFSTYTDKRYHRDSDCDDYCLRNHALDQEHKSLDASARNAYAGGIYSSGMAFSNEYDPVSGKRVN